MHNAYSVYLMSQLAIVKFLIDGEETYDHIWAEANVLYSEYESSEFASDFTVGEYEAMVNFLEDKVQNLVGMEEKSLGKFIHNHNTNLWFNKLKPLFDNFGWVCGVKESTYDKGYLMLEVKVVNDSYSYDGLNGCWEVNNGLEGTVTNEQLLKIIHILTRP